MKRYVGSVTPAAVVAALLGGVAGSVYAGNPPEGKTVLWDESTKALHFPGTAIFVR